MSATSSAGRVWGVTQTTLANAMEVAGCLVLKLPAMDSSRTDAACGHVDAENRKGKLFRCTACGRVDDADVNAARVMRQRALKWLARPSFGQVWPATSVSTTPGAVTAHWTDAPRMRCTSTRLAAIWQPETRGRFHLPHCPISGVHFYRSFPPLTGGARRAGRDASARRSRMAGVRQTAAPTPRPAGLFHPVSPPPPAARDPRTPGRSTTVPRCASAGATTPPR